MTNRRRIVVTDEDDQPAAGDVPMYRSDDVWGTARFVGPLLISDDHSTPVVFADLLLTEEGDDLLYADFA